MNRYDELRKYYRELETINKIDDEFTQYQRKIKLVIEYILENEK